MGTTVTRPSVRSDGLMTSWGAVYGSTIKDTTEQFKAKSDPPQ